MSVFSIAGSGLHAATLRQQVAASNVATRVVDGAQRYAVVASASPYGGVDAGVAAIESVGAVADPLMQDMLEGFDARSAAQANAAVLRRADDTLGTLLDVFA